MPLILFCDPVNSILCLMSRPDDTSDGRPQRRPFLVTLSARALSSVGFGLSIIAISIEWLFAHSVRTRGQVQNAQRPSLPPSHSRDLSARKRTKRVSFAGTSAKFQEVQDTAASLQQPDPTVPKASSNTVIAVPCCPETIKKSSSPSHARTSSLPTITLPHKNAEAVENEGASINGSLERRPLPECPRKAATSNLRSSWPIERVSRITSLRFSTKKPFPPVSPTVPKRANTMATPPSVFCKGDRRSERSEPVPRTFPYAAPYFATPPVPMYNNSTTTVPQHIRTSEVSEEKKHRSVVKEWGKIPH